MEYKVVTTNQGGLLMEYEVVTTKEGFIPLRFIDFLKNYQVNVTMRKKIRERFKEYKIGLYLYECDFTGSSCLVIKKNDIERAREAMTTKKLKIPFIDLNAYYNGKTIGEIMQRNGLHKRLVQGRLYTGWNFDDAINTPKGENRSVYVLGGGR